MSDGAASPASALTSASRFIAVIATACIGEAIVAHDGEYTRRGLAWIAIALIALAGALRCAKTSPWTRGEPDERLVLRSLCVVVALGFLRLWAIAPSGQFEWSNDLRPSDVATWPFKAGVGAACAAGVVALIARGGGRRVALAVALAAHLALGVWILRASPYSDAEPRIDVFLIQQESAAALARGENPYALTFRDMYDTAHADKPSVYGAGLVEHGRLQHGFHYPPLALVCGTAAHAALRDVRYATLAAIALTGLLLYFFAPGPIGVLLALAWWFQSRTYFVLGRAWTDPYVVLAFVACALAHARGSRLAPWLLGMLLASKQHLVVLLPLLPLVWPHDRGARLRYLSCAALGAAAWLVPFWAWDPRAFWRSVVEVHPLQPFRLDALTFTAWLANARGVVIGAWLAFALLVPAWVIALRRAPRSVPGFALASAFVLLVFVAFNKQAFANYYHAIVGIALCALGAQARGDVVRMHDVAAGNAERRLTA